MTKYYTQTVANGFQTCCSQCQHKKPVSLSGEIQRAAAAAAAVAHKEKLLMLNAIRSLAVGVTQSRAAGWLAPPSWHADVQLTPLSLSTLYRVSSSLALSLQRQRCNVIRMKRDWVGGAWVQTHVCCQLWLCIRMLSDWLIAVAGSKNCTLLFWPGSLPKSFV